jgi:hypothetical protein
MAAPEGGGTGGGQHRRASEPCRRAEGGGACPLGGGAEGGPSRERDRSSGGREIRASPTSTVKWDLAVATPVRARYCYSFSSSAPAYHALLLFPGLWVKLGPP